MGAPKKPLRSRREAQALAEENIGLVFLAVNRIAKSHQREPGDLVTFGYMGLLRACELYDSDSGFTLSTFAMHRIRGAILDGIRGEKPWSKRLEADRRKLVNVLDEGLREGRRWTDAELCSHLSWTVSRLAQARSLCEPAPVGDDLVTMCDEGLSDVCV